MLHECLLNKLKNVNERKKKEGKEKNFKGKKKEKRMAEGRNTFNKI